MRLKRRFPTPWLLVLGFPLIWAFEGRTDPPPPPPPRIDIFPPHAQLAVGETLQLRAIFRGETPLDAYDEERVEWRSLNPEIATVSPDGLVVALAPGRAWIHAENEDLGPGWMTLLAGDQADLEDGDGVC